MNLSRRELLTLLGVTAATTVVGTAEAKSEVPQFELYAHGSMRLCKFCKRPVAFKYAQGPNCLKESKLDAVYPCPNGCPPVYYDLAKMLDDMTDHVRKTEDRLLCADKPKELLFGFAAVETGPGKDANGVLLGDVTASWYLPSSPLVSRKALPSEIERPDIWRLVSKGSHKGHYLKSLTDRVRLCRRIEAAAMGQPLPEL